MLRSIQTIKWNNMFLWCVLHLILCFYLVPVALSNESVEELKPESESSIPADQNNENLQSKGSITALQRYKSLFSEHRATQLEAVKSILSFSDSSRKYDLVNIMLKQLFKTLESAKQNLTSYGFLPGDPFPENETIREGVSKVLENTAFFGDMVLRLPDVVHDFYDRVKEWQLLIAWSYGFCIQSQVFEGANEKLLNLMAQEVNIIPVDPTYVNPFKAINQVKEQEEQENGPMKPEKKKSKKKIKRGPRLSHTEL